MEVEFQRNKNLTDMLNSMEGLGRIETHVIQPIKQDITVILDMKIKSTKEVNMKYQITAVIYLQQGASFCRMVLFYYVTAGTVRLSC